MASLLAPATASAFTDQDVAKGRALFERCAGCHYVETYPAPANAAMRRMMTGSDAQHRLQLAANRQAAMENRIDGTRDLKTAYDLSIFIKANMPATQPGSLTEEESFALVSFILQANGAKTDDRPATRESLQKISLIRLFNGPRIWPWALGISAVVAFVGGRGWRARTRAADREAVLAWLREHRGMSC